jgi:DNA recombination protein RmuC
MGGNGNEILIGILLIFGLLILALIVVLLRKSHGSADLSTPLQNLTQAVQTSQTQMAVLTEKVCQLEPVTQGVNGVQVEIRGLIERVGKVEQSQTQAQQSLVALGQGMTHSGAVAQSLVDATAAIREELTRAKNDLTEIQTHAKARQDLEDRTAESIRRLEAVIAGTQSKGSAGENIVELVFSKLPAEWQVRDFTVGDKKVEFGLRLPNNLVLPIDSKWAATSLLEQFVASDDTEEQQRLKGLIETAVMTRTKEVRKYIDPNMTVNFAIATVPDAIYDLCCGIQADVFKMNVVLVSYSMLVPYLLLVFQTILRTSQSIDLQKLDMCLQSVQTSISSLQDELEGRFSKALTMLSNSRDDMSAHLGRASRSMTSVQVIAIEPTTVAELPSADPDLSSQE